MVFDLFQFLIGLFKSPMQKVRCYIFSVCVCGCVCGMDEPMLVFFKMTDGRIVFAQAVGYTRDYKKKSLSICLFVLQVI